MRLRSLTLIVLAPVAIGAAALAMLGPGLSRKAAPSGDAPATAPAVAEAEPEPPAYPVPDPAGRSVLTASDCLAPARLAANGPSPRCVIPFERAIDAVGVTPGGRLMVVALTHAAAATWFLPEVALGPKLEPLPPTAAARVIRVWDRPAQAIFAVGSELQWYDTASGKVLRREEGPGGTIGDLAGSADASRLIVATTGDGRAHLLDGEANGIRSLDGDGQVVHVAIDDAGRRAATSNDVGAIALYDLATEGDAPAEVLTPSLQPAAALAFAGGRLVVAGTDRKLRVIEADGARETAAVDVGSPLVALAVSPDGRHAATAARDRKIRVHALPSGAVLRELAWHEAGIAFLGWGAGPTLVSADNDGNLAIWSSEALGR